MNVELYLDEKGNPVLKLTDNYGHLITDETIIRKVKREQKYKDGIAQLMRDKRYEIEVESKKIVEIYKSTPDLITEDDVKWDLDNLKIQKYNKLDFNEPKPEKSEIEYELKLESDDKINSILFWKNKNLRQKFINDNLQLRYKERFEQWDKKKLST